MSQIVEFKLEPFIYQQRQAMIPDEGRDFKEEWARLFKEWDVARTIPGKGRIVKAMADS